MKINLLVEKPSHLIIVASYFFCLLEGIISNRAIDGCKFPSDAFRESGGSYADMKKKSIKLPASANVSLMAIY